MTDALPPLPRFYSLEDLAEQLDLKINFLYQEIKQKHLIAYRFGKAYRIIQEDYDRYIQEYQEKQGYLLEDIATSLGVGIHYLYREIDRGSLLAGRNGKTYVVTPENYQRYLALKKVGEDDTPSEEEL